MKVLILGNSNDTGSFVPDESKRHRLMRDQLASEFGEPVEVFVRNAWPNERMVAYVMRAVEELDPDMVYLNVTQFPFAYESLPLRIKRIFGKFGGEKAGDAGLRLADSRRWSHNIVFRSVRRLGQAMIGGDPHFTPAEVLERYERLVRELLHREGLAVAVKGPQGKSRSDTPRQRARKEARRQLVHQRLKALCAELHVTYIGSDTPHFVTMPRPKGTKAGDGTHSNEFGHRHSADEHAGQVSEAWRRHLASLAEGDAAGS